MGRALVAGSRQSILPLEDRVGYAYLIARVSKLSRIPLCAPFPGRRPTSDRREWRAWAGL